MRGISVFLYSIRQGLKSMRKNRMFTIASISTMAACLFLFGMFYFIVGNFSHMIKEVESSVGITVFFDEGASQEQMDSIGEAIKSRDEVDHIEFVSAEQAWKEFAAENFKDNPDLVDSFAGDNPLADSASYQVYVKDISKQDELAAYIKGIAGVRLVKQSADAAKSLSNASRLVSYISIAIIVILLAVSIFLIQSTISTGITVRRAEIGIMRLMGASDFFIRAPFIVEGIVIGLIGAAIPLGVLYFMYQKIIVYIAAKFNFIGSMIVFEPVKVVFRTLIPVGVILGAGIGFIGSQMTIRKHLKV